ncbi:MAG: hypothetical protein WCF67_20715 [Chitinophagaceae bacterium]
MNNNITPEMLIRYLDNELDAQERQDLETQLSADVSAQQMLERLRLARQAVKRYAIKEQVAAVHRQEMEARRSDVKKPAAKVYWLRRTMQVAALVLVLVVIAGLIQYSLLDADKLYRSHYAEYTFGTTRDNSKISPLEQAYRAQNMREVIKLYQDAVTHDSTDHFIAGQALLATDNPSAATLAFERQLTLNATLSFKPYQEDAEYYLALAYLKSGDLERALPLFEKINRDPLHAYHHEVSNWYLMQLQWLKRKQPNK